MSTDSIHQQLHKARQELLDLSARNRLLHTPARAASWGLKIVDSTAEVVFDNLVTRGRKLRFASLGSSDDSEVQPTVPPPGFLFDREERGVEFSSVRDDLPVKLPPEALEKKLLKLQLESRTFEEEQGGRRSCRGSAR